jgi:hypothetical protein
MAAAVTDGLALIRRKRPRGSKHRCTVKRCFTFRNEAAAALVADCCNLNSLRDGPCRFLDSLTRGRHSRSVRCTGTKQQRAEACKHHIGEMFARLFDLGL